MCVHVCVLIEFYVVEFFSHAWSLTSHLTNFQLFDDAEDDARTHTGIGQPVVSLPIAERQARKWQLPLLKS